MTQSDTFQPRLGVDLDETCCNTILYWATQLCERFIAPGGMEPQQVIDRYRYTGNVPQWQTPEILEWMEERKVDHELHTKLPLLGDANARLQAIHASHIEVGGYFTVRPQEVLDASRIWLRSLEFPDADVVARPADIAESEGTRWKAELLAGLYPHICAHIDDSPSLLKHLPADYPGTIFHFGHAENARPDLNIIPCPDWEAVSFQLEKNIARIANDARDAARPDRNRDLPISP